MAHVPIRRVRRNRKRRAPRWLWWGVLLALAAAGVGGVLMLTSRPEPAPGDADGVTVMDGNNIVLEPDRWPGKPLPLLEYLDGGDALREGAWTVLLYHENCPHCSEAITRLAEQTRRLAERNLRTRVAMIESPPYAQAGVPPAAKGAGFLHLRLSDRYTWFVPTPTLLRLEAGKVLTAEIESAEGVRGDATDIATVPVAHGLHDFGYVNPDTRHLVLFEITNPAARRMTIRNVLVECPCLTVLTRMPLTVEPAGKASVLMRFHPAVNQIERYGERVMAMTDLDEPKTIAMHVKARIGLDLELLPRRVDLGRLVVGSRRDVRLELINDGRGGHTLRYFSASLKAVAGGRLDRRIDPGGRVPIQITIEATGAPGRRKGVVQVHTDSPLQPTLTTVVSYEVVAASGDGS